MSVFVWIVVVDVLALTCVLQVVVQLTNDESLRVQCIAAILGSTTFGNICSPIADNTILTAMATKCDLASHVKVF